MNVHNLMEEMVYSGVNELFDTVIESKADWLTCSCEQCRLDTICYVLNRLPPHYIKSGRGLAYAQNEDAIDKMQLVADINRIALEGMKQVLAKKRPNHDQSASLPKTPVFNFPTFVGRILDGCTFEPATNLQVQLLMEGALAECIDSTWSNPFTIDPHTPGTFTFWVKPVSADKPGIRKAFPFEILVNREGFDTIRYYFEIASTSESVIRTAVNTDHSHFLPDLHLFPSDHPCNGMDD